MTFGLDEVGGQAVGCFEACRTVPIRVLGIGGLGILLAFGGLRRGPSVVPMSILITAGGRPICFPRWPP